MFNVHFLEIPLKKFQRGGCLNIHFQKRGCLNTPNIPLPSVCVCLVVTLYVVCELLTKIYPLLKKSLSLVSKVLYFRAWTCTPSPPPWKIPAKPLGPGKWYDTCDHYLCSLHNSDGLFMNRNGMKLTPTLKILQLSNFVVFRLKNNKMWEFGCF